MTDVNEKAQGVRLITSESVTEGHPDKVCDQISDAILDAILEQDPNARVAVESTATTGQVHVIGELTTEDAYVEIPTVIRDTLRRIGYTSSEIGFDADSCGVLVSIGQQSADISQGVDQDGVASAHAATDAEIDLQGAGDQGIMFGYATDETKQLFPLPALLSHKLAKKLAEVRKSDVVAGLRPDGKTQVTIEYADGVPVRVDTVLISTQHDPKASQDFLRENLQKHVIEPVLAEIAKQIAEHSGNVLKIDDYKLLVNPTGKFVIGGPMGDAGLTGRKIIVDTYGGVAHHGGGCFSGKDPSKVDRSAAYAMRWVAKNIVAAGLAKRAELQVAYAIGVAAPVSMYIDTFGTATVSEDKIIEAVKQVFDLRPAAIIRDLNLRRPIYSKTAAYGHFGRDDEEFTWEKVDRVQALKDAIL